MRTSLFALLALLAVFSALTGCASIVSGGQKSLLIISQPDDATVEISNVNTGNLVVKAKTPYTAVLSRDNGFFSKAKYNVKISKENYLPQEQKSKRL